MAWIFEFTRKAQKQFDALDSAVQSRIKQAVTKKLVVNPRAHLIPFCGTGRGFLSSGSALIGCCVRWMMIGFMWWSSKSNTGRRFIGGNGLPALARPPGRRFSILGMTSQAASRGRISLFLHAPDATIGSICRKPHKNNMKQPRSFWFSLKRILGLASAGVALSFFIWFLLGLFNLVPSLTQVFGFEHLRIPAGIVVGSLLFTAICFKDL